MAQGDKPIKEFRAGGVRASIWQDEIAGKDNETFSAFSVRVEKRFKGAQGVWQSTNRFRRSELADLELVVFKAREFISLNEREPQDEQAGGPGAGRESVRPR
ncbi:MAG TPA: hypothetical protein VNA25_21000 [Phycisphaerae bacterium]|nr:hypothetical protein [Phycisphaerae bacterium]